MLLADRKKSFIELGRYIANLSESKLEELARSANNQNSWFTEASVSQSLKGISLFLDEKVITDWLSHYDLNQVRSKKVGVIAAGNIPLVCFHDMMTVLLAGHQLMIKPSSDDTYLVHFIINELISINPDFGELIQVVERLNDADAYIATGSDNSAKYFKYYFKEKPNLIRANRSSVAVLTGDESDEDIMKLGQDVFQYYGLGCRNVSKLLVPKGYDFVAFLDGLKSFEWVGNHHKFRNNYDYNKSIYLVNREEHLDTGFLLVRQSSDLVSPISVLYYEYYEGEEQVKDWLSDNKDKIQCVVGDGYIPFGEAQCPAIDDYADGVDTMKFLSQI
ncbi:MAG: acyl-CoA reductase [Reichenbachiella sp.]